MQSLKRRAGHFEVMDRLTRSSPLSTGGPPCLGIIQCCGSAPDSSEANYWAPLFQIFTTPSTTPRAGRRLLHIPIPSRGLLGNNVDQEGSTHQDILRIISCVAYSANTLLMAFVQRCSVSTSCKSYVSKTGLNDQREFQR